MTVKKILVLFILISMICGAAYADVIYETQETRTVTRGVTHTYMERLTEGGWQKINVLKADLTDSNVDVKVLYSSKGISYRSTLSSLAKESGAVAAVNADFFDMTTPAGRTSPLGLTVSEGRVVSSPSHDPALATLASVEGKWLADYFSMNLFIEAGNGNRAQILHINKFHPPASIVMFTPDWGAATPAPDGSCEMVVIDGVVASITENAGNTPIPENGYVLRVDPKINNFFAENFIVGDTASISLEILPYGSIDEAVGGGTVLCRDGKVFKFTSDIAGRHPRTAAGVSEDGKTLFLVTAEGREANTPGMTQAELAELMLSLGAYNAINFDGGGSTEMVARSDTGNIEIVNTPSEGTERPISTALGLASKGTDGVFSEMKLTLSKDFVFVGDSVEVWATSFDNYQNPVQASGELSYSADSGDFIGNKYYPSSPGNHEITVKCADVTAKTTVSVSDDLKTLVTYPASFTGTSAKIIVIGIDSNGFRSIISPESVTYGLTGDGEVSNGDISCNGEATVTAKFGGKTAYCYGNGGETKKFNYNFDVKGPTLLVYPDTVKGAVLEETSIARSGKSSSLFYDFGSLEGPETKAVYMNFGRDIPLSCASYVTMWVYGDGGGHCLRAQIDGDTVYRETLAEKIDFTGWKYIELKLPPGASSGYFSRIYVVENKSAEKKSGSIYVDDLTVLSREEKGYSPEIYDFMKGDVSSPTFVVMPKKPDRNCFLNIVTGRLLENEAKRHNRVFSLGDYENAENVKNISIKYENGCAYIYLAENAPYKKYINLLRLETNGIKNVFVFMENATISDESEKRLFDGTLKKLYDKGINIFVISDGAENSSDLVNGVRFLTLKSKPQINLGLFKESKDDIQMLLFKIDGGNVTYQLRPAL